MKSSNPNSGCRRVEIAKTLDTTTQDPSKNQGGIAVAFCIAGNMVDRETHQHGLGVSQNVSSTLTSADRHAVAYESMSTTGGQCWTTSKASYMTNFVKDKAQTLVATDWKDPPVLVAGNKSSEACAPMTDEDSTDRM